MQSWEAESAGLGTDRRKNDTVPCVQFTIINELIKKHKELSKVGPVKELRRSFIILAHDTTAQDVTEVGSDIEAIEKKAEHFVHVQYHTVSSLYRKIRGSEP